jgi:DNA helicase-2/ATP-dependent DNA helicase PcrA
MHNAKVILGPPGTGKTTRLLNLVDNYLRDGVNPERIGFISFTKKSVTEAKERASKKFNQPLNFFEYFRTIHSTAFYQLAMSRAQVMNKYHYVELGAKLGYKMAGIHRQDEMLYEMSKGDQLVFAESLARMTCSSLKDMWTQLNPDFDIHELQFFSDSLKEFKKEKRLNDFTDMLEKYLDGGYKPDLDVLFIDEAQDLCRLQWNIVEEMSQKSKITYVAGDDDQAIFRWSGADIDYFQAIAKENECEVLSQSYRLPKAIHKFSHNLITRVEVRAPKKFLPTKLDGSVDYITDIADVDMSSGTWLILVRNSYLIPKVVAEIRLMGMTYQTTNYSSREDNAVKAALSWEQLRKAKPLPVTEVKNVIDFVGRDGLGTQKIGLKGKNDTISMQYLVDNKVIKPDVRERIWHEALTMIPDNDIAYYVSVLRRGEKLTSEPRIKISTIHGAKGGEADNVVVFTDISNRTKRAMLENEDDETRVFYVAVTRAKQRLYIVQPKTLNNFQL